VGITSLVKLPEGAANHRGQLKSQCNFIGFKIRKVPFDPQLTYFPLRESAALGTCLLPARRSLPLSLSAKAAFAVELSSKLDFAVVGRFLPRGIGGAKEPQSFKCV
jgi:hypothetical protein